MTKKSNKYNGMSSSLHSRGLCIKESNTAAGGSEPTPFTMHLSAVPPVAGSAWTSS